MLATTAPQLCVSMLYMRCSAALGGALCCVSPFSQAGEPHPGAVAQEGAVLHRLPAQRHAKTPPGLSPLAGARKPCACSAASCEMGERWSANAARLVRRFVALRAHEHKAARVRRCGTCIQLLSNRRARPGPAHADAPPAVAQLGTPKPKPKHGTEDPLEARPMDTTADGARGKTFLINMK